MNVINIHCMFLSNDCSIRVSQSFVANDEITHTLTENINRVLQSTKHLFLMVI